ncbi:MAG TPA: hypothetical protein VNU47_03275 [Candidatus Paceibacterota bacterium]|nr:hypothetical protein [Candidatus Paceibacterota bacterium]
MYDADYSAVSLPPLSSVLGFDEVRRVLSYHWDTYGPVHPNEQRRRQLINIAAGRFFWLCRESEGKTWREITYAELLQSQEQDAEIYFAWAAERGYGNDGYTSRQPEPAPPRKLFGIFPLKRKEPETTYESRGSNVPWVYYTPEQLKRGLDLMVERGMLRAVLRGPQFQETYQALPGFLRGLSLARPQVVITEP